MHSSHIHSTPRSMVCIDQVIGGCPSRVSGVRPHQEQCGFTRASSRIRHTRAAVAERRWERIDGMAQTARQWQIGVGTGVARLAIGSGLVATRHFGARVLGADHDDQRLPNILAMFGVRDMTLGALALFATRPDANVANQVRLQAAMDVVDAVAVGGLVGAGLIPRGRGVAVVGISLLSAAGDYLLSRQAARPPGLTLVG